MFLAICHLGLAAIHFLASVKAQLRLPCGEIQPVSSNTARAAAHFSRDRITPAYNQRLLGDRDDVDHLLGRAVIEILTGEAAQPLVKIGIDQSQLMAFAVFLGEVRLRRIESPPACFGLLNRL